MGDFTIFLQLLTRQIHFFQQKLEPQQMLKKLSFLNRQFISHIKNITNVSIVQLPGRGGRVV